MWGLCMGIRTFRNTVVKSSINYWERENRCILETSMLMRHQILTSSRPSTPPLPLTCITPQPGAQTLSGKPSFFQ